MKRARRNVPALAGLKGLGVTGIAWMAFKVIITYGVIHVLWLRGLGKKA